jgi:D-beta-D-heptose 7-phosphate kinase/D-beta-D-heptose 1-phosphate adenosyltransferase
MKIFVNGTFDLLHIGHIELLNYAKSLGSTLLVAIDSDARVHEKKGVTRPINKENTRKLILENLKAVDYVRIFSSDEELVVIIKEYSPDIMIVGSDWRGKNVIGSEYAKELIFYERTNGESTTKTLQNFILKLK